MSLKDQYCVICGCYLDQSLNRVDGEWLRKVMVITDKETVVSDGSIILDRGGQYVVGDTVYYLTPRDATNVAGRCLGMHVDCYRCVEKYLKYKVRFRDLISIVDPDTGIAPSSYYPVASKYQGPSWEMGDADWNWDDDYLLSNPMKANKSSIENRKRIIKAWEKAVRRMKKRGPQR